MMAQFTAQGRLKTLFSGYGSNDPFPFQFQFYQVKKAFGGTVFTCSHSSVPSQSHKRELGLWGGITRTRLNASKSSSSLNKSKRLNADESIDSGGDRDVFLGEIFSEDPDFERDELAGFRGLVLDISYRSVYLLLYGTNHIRKCFHTFACFWIIMLVGLELTNGLFILETTSFNLLVDLNLLVVEGLTF